MDDEPITKLSYFLWQFDNFQKLRQKIQTGCSAQGLHFDMIMEQMSNQSSTEYEFTLSIEESAQTSDVVKVKKFWVRSYIIDKSEKVHFMNSVEVTFNGQRKTQQVWNAKREEIMSKYNDLLMRNGEIWLISIFEPKCTFQVRHPNCTLDANPWISLDGLSRDIHSLKGTPGDFIVQCKSEQSVLHKNILMARCRKFAKRLEDIGKTEEVFSDLDPKCFEYFEQYVYSGSLPDMTLSDAKKLYKFGIENELNDLMVLCSKIMTAALTEENVCEILLFAHEKKYYQLKKAITEYIVQKGIVKSEKWISFSEANMKLALEVYRAHVERH